MEEHVLSGMKFLLGTNRKKQKQPIGKNKSRATVLHYNYQQEKYKT